jgi:hypothetical protein
VTLVKLARIYKGESPREAVENGGFKGGEASPSYPSPSPSKERGIQGVR